MEQLRKLLISWNVAPLGVIIFLCYMTYLLVINLLGMTCEGDVAIYVALSGLISAMMGLLYKVTISLLKKNKEGTDE